MPPVRRPSGVTWRHAAVALALVTAAGAAAVVTTHRTPTAVPQDQVAGETRALPRPDNLPIQSARPTRTAPDHPPRRPAHIVVLGDSVPAGQACDCPGFGAELGELADASLSNDARSGLTSAGLVRQLAGSAVRSDLRSATLVTITIGANDFKPTSATDPGCLDLGCYDAARIAMVGNVSAAVAAVRELSPADTTIAVTGYWNVFVDGRVAAARGGVFRTVSDRLTRQVNSDLRDVAESWGATFADLYEPFKGDGDLDDTDLLADDGDHPNPLGHHVIARAIARAVGLR